MQAPASQVPVDQGGPGAVGDPYEVVDWAFQQPASPLAVEDDPTHRAQDIQAPGLAPAQAPAARPARVPGQNRFGEEIQIRTIGILKKNNDPAWIFYEWQFLKQVKRILMWEWLFMQKGTDEAALAMWIYAMRILEIDRKAQRELMLLAHSGLVGRTKANRILHQCLYEKGLDARYEDLSPYVSSAVAWARKSMDRPPRMHRQLWEPDWSWSYYQTCFPSDLAFAPDSVPEDAVAPNLCDPETGVPLPPPRCWRVPHRLTGPQAPGQEPLQQASSSSTNAPASSDPGTLHL